MLQIKFLDLSKQQKTIEKHLKINLDKVLSDSKFIMGPEVKAVRREFTKIYKSKLLHFLLLVELMRLFYHY